MKQPNSNYDIKAAQVRVINNDGTNLGLMPVTKALQLAKAESLDLVEINSSETGVPVCKIMEIGKFMYAYKKKHKQVKIPTQKEFQLRPNIDPHDLQTKINQMQTLLDKGHPIRVLVVFKGREVSNKEQSSQAIISVLKENMPGRIFTNPKSEDKFISLQIRRK